MIRWEGERSVFASLFMADGMIATLVFGKIIIGERFISKRIFMREPLANQSLQCASLKREIMNDSPSFGGESWVRQCAPSCRREKSAPQFMLSRQAKACTTNTFHILHSAESSNNTLYLLHLTTHGAEATPPLSVGHVPSHEATLNSSGIATHIHRQEFRLLFSAFYAP